MSDGHSALSSRLQQLQSRFTWDLRKEDMDLENLSTRLQDHIELQLGQPGAVARSYSFLAYVRYIQNQPQEAESLLIQSEKTTRECYGEDREQRLIVTYGDLAWLKYHTGDYMQSQTYWQRVEDILLKYPTGSSALLHPEVYGEKAWTYLKFSRSYYPKALEFFCKALELQPDDCEWNAGYAIALYRTESGGSETSQQSEESPATKQLRRALEINPDDGVLLSMLALKLNPHQEAESLVERALKLGSDNPHVIRYIAKYFRNKGDVERAIDLLNRALKKTSQSAFIHHQLALCYKSKKSPANTSTNPKHWRRLCIQHLEEAVKIRPSFVLAMVDLAVLHGEEKDLDRAEKWFQQVLQMLPGSEKSICQGFHKHYADFQFYHNRNMDKAIDHYTQKLKQIAERRTLENRNDAEAYSVLGLVAKVEGKKKEAAEFYDKALDCDGNNDKYLTALCELRMELQEAAEDTSALSSFTATAQVL
ncbi:interferon-induced protein with tetratricopeptide repeats 5-like isoform X2 [Mastacembelus armatus]|uniref:interferon-induced protein with tetratricopeptide repeats 5-like isoform X2 n=1 Tax=Mastacembelus armatus TaxID=205130 RepID=UPI000E45CAA3|nr:interferon-induced protein with tetratricopeptide repeats 5-like isoform X2 [Mastacembelus armatus]